MGLEHRHGRGTYYTRTRRQGGKFVREYVGSGPLAQHAAAEDARRRAEHAAARLIAAQREASRAALTRQVASFCRLIDGIVAASLEAAGHHKHGGEWRKRMSAVAARIRPTLPAGPMPLTAAEHDLIARTRNGEPTPIEDVRALLAGHPEVWQAVGDLGRITEAKLIDLLVGKPGLVRESVLMKLAALKDGLLDAKSGPAERLAVDRVGVTWLDMALADTDAIVAAKAGMAGYATVQRRVTAAQARHLAALKQLEVIRRLLRPVGATLKLADFVPGTCGHPAGAQVWMFKRASQ